LSNASSKITASQYIEHRSELERVARKIVGCPQQAEDIVQEAFYKYSVALSKNHEEKNIGYLFQIVKNLSIDLLRRSKTEDRIFDHQKSEDLVNDFTNLSVSADQLATQKLQNKRIIAILESFPKEMRVAVIMHLIEGYNLREIAEELDVSLGKAHSLVKEGTLRCREEMKTLIL